MRGTVGQILMQSLYAMRTALFIFFLLFLLRALLRNQWIAALAIVVIFTGLNMLTSDHPLADGATTFLYFALAAAAVLRFGLTTLAVSVLVANLLDVAPATTDLSAWYIGATLLVVAIVLALPTWAVVTATQQVRQARLSGRGRFGEVRRSRDDNVRAEADATGAVQSRPDVSRVTIELPLDWAASLLNRPRNEPSSARYNTKRPPLVRRVPCSVKFKMRRSPSSVPSTFIGVLPLDAIVWPSSVSL